MNKDIGYSHTDGKLWYEYTQRQRRKTLKAVTATSIDALRQALTQQLKKGKRSGKNWVEMDTAILSGYVFSCFVYGLRSHLPRGTLQLNDMAGNDLLTILPPIPSKIVEDF
jgi:hypothetical protein